MLTRSSKGKAADDVPAKRSTPAVVPEEVTAMLRTVTSSLNAATLDLMDLPCAAVVARDGVTAVMADCARQLNKVLGTKRQSVFEVSEVIIDVFQFLCRRELDTLQIVKVRFNTIVENTLTIVCLRQLKSAKMVRSGAYLILIMKEVGAKKMTRLPTSVNNETSATALLLNACQSSRVDSLELYGRTPMNVDFVESLMLCAPTIFLNEFYMRKRTLSNGIADDNVL